MKIAILSILLLSSCARLFGRNYQVVEFYTNERDVEMYIGDEMIGSSSDNEENKIAIKVPLLKSIGGEDEYMFRFVKTGYLNKIVKIQKTTSGSNGYWQNDLLCTIDKVPGFLLILPPLISINSGLCDKFQNEYIVKLAKKEQLLPKSQDGQQQVSNTQVNQNNNSQDSSNTNTKQKFDNKPKDLQSNDQSPVDKTEVIDSKPVVKEINKDLYIEKNQNEEGVYVLKRKTTYKFKDVQSADIEKNIKESISKELKKDGKIN